ncbi:MAG: pyridoxal-phosphate dependent enzyme [Candidatus Thorarchaeota archaeon]|nr:pyridoxal-phosphate dependent enzyme [Candidatus Thorarchaeota archaeon]
MVSLKDIQEAQSRIKDAIEHTPVMTSKTLDRLTGCEVFLKCENYQRAGAFKFRGAFNAVSLLSKEQRERGVIAHSSGNHAQALSLAASMQGVGCTIVMPSNSPSVKVEATKGYGAEVIFCEPTLQSREDTTDRLIEKHGYTLVHPYDNENVIAGAGTAALELIIEVDELDYMLAPVGGGGLLSGTSIATRGFLPKATILGVEPRNADDAMRSFQSGDLIPSVNPRTIADGLRTSLSRLTFSIIRENVDDIITVSEQEIVEAMRFLWERMKIVVEPSGAVALAGVFSIAKEIQGERIGAILSGGNVDLQPFFSQFEGIN